MQVKFVGEEELRLSENPDGVLSLTPGRIYTVLGICCDRYRLLNDDRRSPDNKLPFRSRRYRPDLRSEADQKLRPFPGRYAPAPVLYSQELFEVVDNSEPDFWVCEEPEEGERYCEPKEWGNVGFWEDYFDYLPEAHALFWDVYYRLYSDA